MLPHCEGNLIRMKCVSLFLATVLLASTSVHAEGVVQKALRDAAVYHDEERIHSLIAREAKAENSHDYIALKQVLKKLSNAADPAADGSDRIP
jgi:hypothetical protein